MEILEKIIEVQVASKQEQTTGKVFKKVHPYLTVKAFNPDVNMGIDFGNIEVSRGEYNEAKVGQTIPIPVYSANNGETYYFTEELARSSAEIDLI